MTDLYGRHETLEEAQAAFALAEKDVVGDQGQEAWDLGYGDIAMVVVDNCVPRLREWMLAHRDAGYGLY